MKNKMKIEPIDQAADDESRKHPTDGSQGRPKFHSGTTVQGGSDFGQGSHYLAGDAYKQGRERNEGANYDNEAGRLSELPDGGDS
jgi:hypothetical protein